MSHYENDLRILDAYLAVVLRIQNTAWLAYCLNYFNTDHAAMLRINDNAIRESWLIGGRQQFILRQEFGSK